MSDHAAAARRFGARWVGPAFLALIALAMLVWTWATWPDVLIDFGAQLYIPWRISQGDALYRDISCFHGPFSQYLHALLFRVFGPGLRAVVVSNLVVVAVVTAALWRLFASVSTRFATTAACATFLLLFAFAQFVTIGNYNYVCPYVHEITHGLTLSLLALLCAWRAIDRRPGWWLASGLCLGFAFLTRIEVFAAGAAGVMTAAALACWPLNRPIASAAREAARIAGLLLAGTVLPVLLAIGGLSSAMPWTQAVRGVCSSIVAMTNPAVTDLPFFRSGMGTDNTTASLGLMLVAVTWHLAFLAPLALVALWQRRGARGAAAVGVIAAAAVGVGAWLARGSIPWFDLARPLPAFMFALGCACGIRLIIDRDSRAAQLVSLKRLSLIVLATVLLGKMILNARIHQYGFALAMPATLVAVVALIDWLPAAIDGRGGNGRVFRMAAIAWLLCGAAVALSVQSRRLDAKRDWVGVAGDAFRADARGPLVEQALSEIVERTSPEQTLVVLPEGIMLNYLTRRASSVPYTNFMPTEIAIFGEDEILRSLKQHPPDLIALVHKDTIEFGRRWFGADYGRHIYQWIVANYRPVSRLGAPPFTGQEFGIEIRQRITIRPGER